MKLSYRLSLLCQLPSPTQELETPVYDIIPTLFQGKMVDVLQVHGATVGCRCKFYDDGSEVDIVGAFWVLVENPVNESNTPVRRLRLSFKIQFEDGFTELLPAAWLAVASGIIKIPFDFERQMNLQNRKKQYLHLKFGINE